MSAAADDRSAKRSATAKPLSLRDPNRNVMRAMMLTQQEPMNQSPLVLREVDEPEPAANEVRIRVSVCAVCRTDIHIVEGDLALHRNPVIPGHQVVGRIDRVGVNVT